MGEAGVRKIKPRDGKIIHIVYDVDDVLNNLNYIVFKKLGLLGRMPKLFNISDCDEYTESEKKEIFDCYGNPDIFKATSLVAGADKICQVEKTGRALVYINSRNFNSEVASIKINQLLKNIPGLNYFRIDMQIGLGDRKKISEYADIVIEDCITNLLKYPTETVKILINKTYNQAQAYGITDAEYNILRVENLTQVIELIDELV